MDIFGIGLQELIFILIIAMIVIGPRDLGKVGRQLGRFLNRMYKSEGWRMLNEASRTLRNLPNRLAREAQLEELDAIRNDLKETGQMIQGEMKSIDKSLEAWKPTASPPQKTSESEPQENPAASSEAPAEDEA